MSYSTNLKLTTPDLSSSFSVIGYIYDDTEYKVGYGYLDELNRVWIFKKPEDKVSSYPWFTKDAYGSLEFSERNDKDSVFTRKNCVNLDIDYIKSNIDKCLAEYRKNPLPVNSDAEIYEVKNTDTPLGMLIKLFLNDTKIDLAQLSSELEISNLKSSLKRTDLSLRNFMRWVSALGLKYTIILEDNGAGISNLNGERFVYQSNVDAVSKVHENIKF